MLARITSTLGIALLLASSVVLAKDVKVTVKMDSIKLIKTTEKGGDELYFSVTTYPQKAKSYYQRIPMYPVHWLSKNLEEVKDVVLFEKSFTDNDGAQIIISLVEQDLPPWNIDDHLGSIKLTLHNENGNLIRKWSIPDYQDETEVIEIEKSSDKRSYTFKGDGGEYQVFFSITEN